MLLNSDRHPSIDFILHAQIIHLEDDHVHLVAKKNCQFLRCNRGSCTGGGITYNAVNVHRLVLPFPSLGHLLRRPLQQDNSLPRVILAWQQRLLFVFAFILYALGGNRVSGGKLNTITQRHHPKRRPLSGWFHLKVWWTFQWANQKSRTAIPAPIANTHQDQVESNFFKFKFTELNFFII